MHTPVLDSASGCHALWLAASAASVGVVSVLLHSSAEVKCDASNRGQGGWGSRNTSRGLPTFCLELHRPIPYQVDAVATDGETSLAAVAGTGAYDAVECVRLLLAAGCASDRASHSGWTPLIRAGASPS